MHKSDLNKAQQIARSARTFEQQTTGQLPGSVTVVLKDDTVVITLRGTFSPAETALAKRQESAAQLRELHRHLFTIASEPLRQEIRHITGAEVREATVEVEPSTGTVVQVFSLAHTVPEAIWSGSDPGSTGTEEGLERCDDGGVRT